VPPTGTPSLRGPGACYALSTSNRGTEKGEKFSGTCLGRGEDSQGKMLVRGRWISQRKGDAGGERLLKIRGGIRKKKAKTVHMPDCPVKKGVKRERYPGVWGGEGEKNVF